MSEVIPPAKPRLSVDALTSEAAGEEYDNAVEAWADDLWRREARNCRVFVRLGMKLPRGMACPPADADPNLWTP